MSKKYCHHIFPAGLTCMHRSKDMCLAGIFCRCNYRSNGKPSETHNITEKVYKHLSFQRDMYYIRKGELPPM